MTQQEARAFFGVVCHGEHHAPEPMRPFGRGWKVNFYGGQLSTFDFDYLTRLVIHAHDMCYRVEVMQGGPGKVGVAVWKRDTREGGMCDRHPTMEQALAEWRKQRPASLCVREPEYERAASSAGANHADT
jgi:hypothetical protein